MRLPHTSHVNGSFSWVAWAWKLMFHEKQLLTHFPKPLKKACKNFLGKARKRKKVKRRWFHSKILCFDSSEFFYSVPRRDSRDKTAIKYKSLIQTALATTVLRSVASGGGSGARTPHLTSVPPHLTFGPPLAAYIQYYILKMWPPSGFWPLLLVLGSPCC